MSLPAASSRAATVAAIRRVGFDPEPAPVVAALTDRAERLTIIDADVDQARSLITAL